MENKKEVYIDTSEAQVAQAKVDGQKVSEEQLRNVYPEEDPRKFNTHYTEQEAVEYASKEHLQPITGIDSADKEHIHAPHEEKEKASTKEYPKLQVWAVAAQGILTVICFFYFRVPLFLVPMAFGASALIMPNYKLLPKKFPRLGFNPLAPLLVVDICLLLIGFMLLVGQLF